MPNPMAAALCRVEGNPTWWDDEIAERETDRARTLRHGKAKAVCGRCPAILACAELFDPELDAGVWFGVVHERGFRTHKTTAHLGQRNRRTA